MIGSRREGPDEQGSGGGPPDERAEVAAPPPQPTRATPTLTGRWATEALGRAPGSAPQPVGPRWSSRRTRASVLVPRVLGLAEYTRSTASARPFSALGFLAGSPSQVRQIEHRRHRRSVRTIRDIGGSNSGPHPSSTGDEPSVGARASVQFSALPSPSRPPGCASRPAGRPSHRRALSAALTALVPHLVQHLVTGSSTRAGPPADHSDHTRRFSRWRQTGADVVDRSS
jgi:hypothetical protein